MKIQTQIFLLTLSNGEKAVPPKDPLVRLEQLKSHSTKLMADFFSSCQGDNFKNVSYKIINMKHCR